MSACTASCQKIGRHYETDIGDISATVLVRSSQALQARDFLGILFYKQECSGEVVYHFNYLTLLLVGALDALSKLVNKIYAVTPNERIVSFRNEQFRQELRSLAGERIYDLLSSPDSIGIQWLLPAIRNTVHTAGPQLHSLRHSASSASGCFLIFPAETTSRAIDKGMQSDELAEWGIFSRPRQESSIDVEPYTFASKASKKVVELIDAIAAEIDVSTVTRRGGIARRSGLISIRHVKPRQIISPSEERERYAILGW